MSPADGHKIPTRLHTTLDYHVHTELSPCAEPAMTCRAVLDRAEELGYYEIGLVDHIRSQADAEVLGVRRSAVVRRRSDLVVRCGAEVDLACPDRPLVPIDALGDVDYVMLSATHFGQPGIVPAPPGSARDVARYVLRMFESAVRMPGVHVIAHPLCAFGLIGDGRPFADLAEMLDLLGPCALDPVVEVLARNGVALEINAKLFVPGVFAALAGFYTRCADAGVRFSFGSDAHRLLCLGMTRGFTPIVELLGIGDDQVWRPESRLADRAGASRLTVPR